MNKITFILLINLVVFIVFAVMMALSFRNIFGPPGAIMLAAIIQALINAFGALLSAMLSKSYTAKMLLLSGGVILSLGFAVCCIGSYVM